MNEAFLAWMLSGKTIDEFEYRKAGRTIVNGRPLEVEHRSWQVRGNVTPDEMILKSFNLLEEQRYIKADIPAKVKEDSNVITKSTAASSTAPIL